MCGQYWLVLKSWRTVRRITYYVARTRGWINLFFFLETFENLRRSFLLAIKKKKKEKNLYSHIVVADTFKRQHFVRLDSWNTDETASMRMGLAGGGIHTTAAPARDEEKSLSP